MNAFEVFLVTIQSYTDNIPPMYGAWHIFFLALMFVAIALVVVFFRNANDAQNRKLVLSFALISIAFEIYKQLVLSYPAYTMEWKYVWGTFPLLFCSTPMYAGLIAALIPKGRVQYALHCFIAYIGLAAGIVAMFLPFGMFTNNVVLNVQTMIHHSLQVIIGLHLIISGHVKMKLSATLYAAVVLLAFAGVATIVNETYFYTAPLLGSTNPPPPCNMMFLSRHYNCPLVVFKDIYPVVPFPVFLFLYLFALSLSGVVVLGVAFAVALVIRFANRTKQRIYD